VLPLIFVVFARQQLLCNGRRTYRQVAVEMNDTTSTSSQYYAVLVADGNTGAVAIGALAWKVTAVLLLLVVLPLELKECIAIPQ